MFTKRWHAVQMQASKLDQKFWFCLAGNLLFDVDIFSHLQKFKFAALLAGPCRMH
jgi:hypothetical protein